jgi:uncharacterized membrane protein YgcG
MFALSSGLALGEGGYPASQELLVNDFANVISGETEGYLRGFLGELSANSGIQMTVVTIGSIGDYGTGDTTIESFATNLFNTWGIGDAQRDDGILLLVAVRDRKVRIEVGSGYGDSLNSDMQTVIDEYMLPAFRQEDYERGIYDGTRAIIQEVTGTAPANPQPRSSPPINIGASFWNILPWLIVGLIVFSIIRSILRGGITVNRGGGSAYYDTDDYSSSSDSGSSSSDFGGGDSSGGGASGDW